MNISFKNHVYSNYQKQRTPSFQGLGRWFSYQIDKVTLGEQEALQAQRAAQRTKLVQSLPCADSSLVIPSGNCVVVYPNSDIAIESMIATMQQDVGHNASNQLQTPVMVYDDTIRQINNLSHYSSNSGLNY